MVMALEQITSVNLGQDLSEESVVIDPHYRAHSESISTKKFCTIKEQHYFINVLNELRIKAEARKDYVLL